MTTITIRVQARGGMFLGPDSFGGAFITLKNALTQEIISSGFTDTGGSGKRETEYIPDASQYPIVIPPDPYTIRWLSAKGGAVNYTTELDISTSTLIEFAAKVPLPPEQGDQYVSMTQWVNPCDDPSPGPGFVLLIPGLWVQPVVITEGNTIRIRAKVTMMCGCEINSNSPWVPADFAVSAKITQENFEREVPLEFDVNSQFVADISIDQKGQFDIVITGYQKSTGNTGVAKTIFEIG